MTPSTSRPSQPVTKPEKSIVQLKPQSQPSKYFDVKPVSAPTKPVHRIAPALQPSKGFVDVVPPPVVAAQPPAKAAEVAPATLPEQTAEPAVAPEQPVGSVVVVGNKSRLKHLLRKPSKRRALHGMAVLLFITGIYVAVDGWFANRAVTTQASVLSEQVDREQDGESEQSGRDALSEAKPAGVRGYSVAPDLPRAIRVPTLKVEARVLHLGVKKDNSLAAPSNIYDAGWYTASARPSDKGGAILIDGHVSGPTKPGVFYGLKKLKGGEEIILERGDGQALTFVVKQVETVKADEVDMLRMLNSAEPGKLGLNLITCGGEFDSSDSSFKSRVLVFAVQK